MNTFVFNLILLVGYAFVKASQVPSACQSLEFVFKKKMIYFWWFQKDFVTLHTDFAYTYYLNNTRRGKMLGIMFKRVPVSGIQARNLRDKIQRMQNCSLNDDDRKELLLRKKIKNRISYDVTWEN